MEGGEGEIRTPGTLTGTPAFEAGAIDHSATSPRGCRPVYHVAGGTFRKPCFQEVKDYWQGSIIRARSMETVSSASPHSEWACDGRPGHSLAWLQTR